MEARREPLTNKLFILLDRGQQYNITWRFIPPVQCLKVQGYERSESKRYLCEKKGHEAQNFRSCEVGMIQLTLARNAKYER